MHQHAEPYNSGCMQTRARIKPGAVLWWCTFGWIVEALQLDTALRCCLPDCACCAVLSWQCNDGHLIQCALECVEQPAGQQTPNAHIYSCPLLSHLSCRHAHYIKCHLNVHAAVCLICSTWPLDLNNLLNCFECSILVAAIFWLRGLNWRVHSAVKASAYSTTTPACLPLQAYSTHVHTRLHYS
jgi:hypothetical protein